MQRKSIVLYYTKTHHDKLISIFFLAKKLAVKIGQSNKILNIFIFKRGHVIRFRNFDEKTKARLANTYVFKEAIDTNFLFGSDFYLEKSMEKLII